MADETYQGWANRETWAASLWINNEQGWYETAREIAAEKRGEVEPEHLLYEVADALKARFAEGEWDVDEHESTYGEPMPTALVRTISEIGSLWRIEWEEIAKGFLEE